MAANSDSATPAAPGSVSAPGAQPHQALPVPDGTADVANYLQQHHKGSWHITLNNHASTRPKAHGGPVVPSVTACKTFTPPGSASGLWRCVLHMPNSFAAGDGVLLHVEAEGSTKMEASERACHRAVAQLLLLQPGQFLLRPPHWDVTPAALLEGLPAGGGPHQALPVHARSGPPARAAEGQVEAESAEEVDERVAELLRRCLRGHGGSFDPSRISRAALGQEPDEDAVYSQLDRLLQPGGLRPFVERHPEFTWSASGRRGMVVAWATGAAPGSASVATGHPASAQSGGAPAPSCASGSAEQA